MYDFCLTYPFAVLLACGGTYAYWTKESVPSLVGGLGTAMVLSICGHASLSAYQQGKLCKPATGVALLTTGVLAFVTMMRFVKTGNFMPAGLISALSAAMSAFLAWNISALKEPLPGHKDV